MAPGSTGSRTTGARCRGKSEPPAGAHGRQAIPTSLIGLMHCPRRYTPGTRTAGHSATPVGSLRVGRWAQRPAAAADAQHRGGAGGSWAHAEGGRHALGAPYPLGGERAGVALDRKGGPGQAGAKQGRPGRRPRPPGLRQAPPLGAGGGALLPGAVEQPQPQFVSRFLEGQSGVTIKHVACGDLFTACLTGESFRGLWEGTPRAPSLIALSFAICTLN